jgi:hypothetical protein
MLEPKDLIQRLEILEKKQLKVLRVNSETT